MKPEWEEKLKDIGNTRSNAIYEEHLPPNFNRSENKINDILFYFIHIGGLKKDEARFRFIQEKYREMKYSSTVNKEKILAESK